MGFCPTVVTQVITSPEAETVPVLARRPVGLHDGAGPATSTVFDPFAAVPPAASVSQQQPLQSCTLRFSPLGEAGSAMNANVSLFGWRQRPRSTFRRAGGTRRGGGCGAGGIGGVGAGPGGA